MHYNPAPQFTYAKEGVSSREREQEFYDHAKYPPPQWGENSGVRTMPSTYANNKLSEQEYSTTACNYKNANGIQQTASTVFVCAVLQLEYNSECNYIIGQQVMLNQSSGYPVKSHIQ